MTRMTWTLPVLLAALGVVGGVALVAGGASEPARAAVEEPGLSVAVLEVQAGPVPVTVSAQGVVEPSREVQLAARVAGPVVWTADDLRPGRRVTEGETLARIDATAFRATVADARSGVASSKEALALEDGRGEVATLEQSLIGGQVSELAKRAPQRESAAAKLAASEASLVKAERDLANTRIRAPFDGLLVEESIERGSYLATGASVGRIVGSDTMWVELPMSPTKAAQLDVPGYNAADGSLAELRLLGTDGVREGVVVGIAGEVDATTRTVTVLVEIDAPLDPAFGPVVLPGTFVDVTIAGHALENAVRVPSAALHDASSVWTVSPEHTLSRVPVEVLWREGESVIVRGLGPSADVVIDASGTLLEGAVASVEVQS